MKNPQVKKFYCYMCERQKPLHKRAEAAPHIIISDLCATCHEKQPKTECERHLWLFRDARLMLPFNRQGVNVVPGFMATVCRNCGFRPLGALEIEGGDVDLDDATTRARGEWLIEQYGKK